MQIPASIVFQKNWQAYQKGYKILLNEGSSRSTKTWSFFLLMYLFCKENASKRIVVMRDTQKACRELVETEFKDWLKDPYSRKKQFENGLITSQQLRDYLNKENLLTDLLENKSNHTYTFSNDSRIIFTGADNIEQVIGKENHLVWINEPYKFSDKVLGDNILTDTIPVTLPAGYDVASLDSFGVSQAWPNGQTSQIPGYPQLEFVSHSELRNILSHKHFVQ